MTPPWPGGGHLLHEPRMGTELCPQELTPGPRCWGRGGGHWSGCVCAAPAGQGSKFDSPHLPSPLHSLPFPPTVGCTEKLFIYMYKCLFSNGFPPPPCPDPPSMAIAPAPSTLYIMYRKSLCMVEGGGRLQRAGGPLSPSPQALPHRPRSLLKAIPSPGHLASGGRGKTHLVNYF